MVFTVSATAKFNFTYRFVTILFISASMPRRLKKCANFKRNYIENMSFVIVAFGKLRRIMPICVLAFFLFSNNSLAQIVVDAAQFGGGNTAEASAYPTLSARIRALRSGTPIVLASANIFIVEGNHCTQPFKVEPINDSYQKIYWHSRSRGISTASQIVVVYGSESDTVAIKYSLDNDVQVRFSDFTATPMYSLSFGNVVPGKDTTIPTYVLARTTRVDANQRSESLRIDSIATRTRYFSWEWKGTPIVSSRTPPTYIQSPFRYRINITFRPDAPRFYRDILTVYYEGGAEEYFELTGNSFDLPQNTILNITQPNTRQNLTPCQIVDIRWKGSVAGAPTYVDYTTDGGRTWQNIGQTLDSSIAWTIPAQYTDSLLLRARQDFVNFSEVNLRGETAGAYSLGYNGDGSNVAVAYENGKVIEYDAAQHTILQKYDIGAVAFPMQKAFCFGIIYTDTNRVAAGFRRADGTQEFDFFERGNSDPALTAKIAVPVKLQRLVVDPSGQIIICVPEFGNSLYLFSSTDGSLIKTISYPAPITAFALNADGKGVIAMLDGTIAQVSAPDFAVASPVKFSELPIINGVALSPDGQLWGLASKAESYTISSGGNSTVYIVDIASKTIIRTLRKSSSDALKLAFNGTSRYLGLGYPYQPQIALWQIVNNEFNGGLSGHAGQMTSLTYSPDGRVIATTALLPDNVTLRNFSYPETDISDEFIRIVPANINVSATGLKPNYLMNRRDTILKTTVCNTGEAAVIFETAKLLANKHFSFVKPITPLDTLFPGECLDILLSFQPKDTGWTRDTILLTSCSRQFSAAVSGYSMNRSIDFLADGIEFGDSCVGDSLKREIDILRNNDPVPLELDGISPENGFTSGFSFSPPLQKTVLQPGETLKTTVKFSPKVVGPDVSKMLVMHSNQTSYIPAFTLRGRGIGADVAITSDIRFIPEISARTISIKNNSPNDVTLRSISITPASALSVSPMPPLVIPANDSVILNIAVNEPLAESGTMLEAEFNPCIVKKIITAGAYSGTSSVSAPIVEADPRGEAVIPILYKNAENKPYKGIRFFEGEITLNPRLFLPLRAECDYGTATIIRNEIIGDKRIIGFRAEGDFPLSGIVAKLIGPAGLAETDRTPVDFTTTARYWGAATQTSTSSGELRIPNTCDGCRIIHNKTLAILAVAPNPASTETIIEFYTPNAGEYVIEILNEIGISIVEPRRVYANEGINSFRISLGTLQTGAYRTSVRGAGGTTSAPTAIIR